MLHLIPRPLHRALLRVAHRLRQRWRSVFKLPIEGVSVLVSDLDGRLLMVRHSYGSGAWLLPGGGMKRGESPEDAARREIAEELGCRIESVRVIETIAEVISGAPHTAHLVAARTLDRPRPDGREVIEARFFPSHSLPEPQTPLTRTRIAAWRARAR
jgi:8-oxo-dGTP pyrophosphatase MutT (NUDIX family)